MTRWVDPERLDRQIVETLERQKKTAAFAKSMLDIYMSQGFDRQEAFFFLAADRVGSMIEMAVMGLPIADNDDEADEEGV